MDPGEVFAISSNPFMAPDEKLLLLQQRAMAETGTRAVFARLGDRPAADVLESLIEDGWLERSEDGYVQDGARLERLVRSVRGWLRGGPENRDRGGADWVWKRFAALERDGYVCQDCGATGRLHVHHKTPVQQGGANSLDNLVTLCPRCHGRAEVLARAGLEWQPTAHLAAKRRRSKRTGKLRYPTNREIVDAIRSMQAAKEK